MRIQKKGPAASKWKIILCAYSSPARFSSILPNTLFFWVAVKNPSATASSRISVTSFISFWQVSAVHRVQFKNPSKGRVILLYEFHGIILNRLFFVKQSFTDKVWFQAFNKSLFELYTPEEYEESVNQIKKYMGADHEDVKAMETDLANIN